METAEQLCVGYAKSLSLAVDVKHGLAQNFADEPTLDKISMYIDRCGALTALWYDVAKARTYGESL